MHPPVPLRPPRRSQLTPANPAIRTHLQLLESTRYDISMTRTAPRLLLALSLLISAAWGTTLTETYHRKAIQRRQTTRKDIIRRSQEHRSDIRPRASITSCQSGQVHDTYQHCCVPDDLQISPSSSAISICCNSDYGSITFDVNTNAPSCCPKAQAYLDFNGLPAFDALAMRCCPGVVSTTGDATGQECCPSSYGSSTDDGTTCCHAGSIYTSPSGTGSACCPGSLYLDSATGAIDCCSGTVYTTGGSGAPGDPEIYACCDSSTGTITSSNGGYSGTECCPNAQVYPPGFGSNLACCQGVISGATLQDRTCCASDYGVATDDGDSCCAFANIYHPSQGGPSACCANPTYTDGNGIVSCCQGSTYSVSGSTVCCESSSGTLIGSTCCSNSQVYYPGGQGSDPACCQGSLSENKQTCCTSGTATDDGACCDPTTSQVYYPNGDSTTACCQHGYAFHHSQYCCVGGVPTSNNGCCPPSLRQYTTGVGFTCGCSSSGCDDGPA